jgi:hypothetical protein
MDIVDMAIHRVVWQKSDSKKTLGQNMLAFQRYFGARNW